MAYPTIVSSKPADPEERIVYRDMPTPLGELRLVASPKGLRGVWFTDQTLLPSAQAWTHTQSDPILEQAGRGLLGLGLTVSSF